MKRHVFAAAFGALLVVLPVRDALRADATLYTVQDLGTTLDGLVPTITGMNASGQVSGYVTPPSTSLPLAVRYTPGLGWEYLPGLSTMYSVATGINDSGDVVGTHFNLATGFRAYRHVGGLATEIEPLPGGTSSFGFGISASGEVVGQSDSHTGNHGFRAVGTTPVEVPMPAGSSNGTACGINAAGQIAASAHTAAGREQPYRLEADNSVTPITPFDGATGTGQACAIDAAGRVGGRATLGNVLRGFTFLSGSPINVDTFAGSQESRVEAISGDVAVGWFVLTAGSALRAFVNTPDGSFDLNTLVASGSGWNLQQAFAVNADGHIAGNGTLGGAPRAFLMKPAADTTDPTIHSVTASPSSITPPNGAMVAVSVSVNATDDPNPAPVCVVTGIDAHGAPASDFSVTGALSGSVKATGGATYTFAVACTDAAGNSATGSVDVVVPPDTTAPVIASVSASPAEIWPPNGNLVPVTVSVSATDDSGATPVCSLTSISATGGTAYDYAITGLLSAKVRAVGGRTYTLNVGCSDAAGNSASAATAVFVVPDTKAPVIHNVSASPNAIWPPNGKMVPVAVTVSASDDVDSAPYCYVKAVTSNGSSAFDAFVDGQFAVSVRAEKNDDGSTRVYTIKVMCKDAAGNVSYGTTNVVLGKDLTAMKGHAVTMLKKLVVAVRSSGHLSRGSSR